MLVVKKYHSQKYAIVAPRGETPARDEALKGVFWKHSKHQPGYVFSPSYRRGTWNGRVNNFSPTDIRAGFLKESLDALDNANVEWQWEDNKQPEVLPFRTETSNEFSYEEFTKFCSDLIEAVNPKFKKKHNIELELRDYQVDAGYKLLREKIGIALHSTSAGKSIMIAFVLGFLFYKAAISKAVILVPLQSLVTQFYRDLIDYGFKESFIGKVFSDSKEINKPIVVATAASAKNIIDTLDSEVFFDKTDMLICDEVHRSSAKTTYKTVTHFKNAKYFFGCTGTLPESELDKDKVFSIFGQILDKRNLKELENEYNAVTKVKVGILNFCYGKMGFLSRLSMNSSTDEWNQEVEFLQNDDKFRNPYIIGTIKNNFNSGRNVVVLVKNIAYGVRMYNKIKEEIDCNNEQCVFWIDGTMKLRDVDAIIEKCKQDNFNYVIVTDFQKFSTGINIKTISAVFLIDAGQSDVTVAQTIGRGVRKNVGKEDVLVFDCSCDLKYGSRHGRKRKKLYEREGFFVMEKNIEVY